MKVQEHPLYREDIVYVAALDLPWDLLQDSSVLISGAGGLIGSCLVDVLMERNSEKGLNCTVYALGRNVAIAHERFASYWERDDFCFLSQDINEPLQGDNLPDVGYAFHLASNTHPVAYATDPIGTVETNIIGLKNMLDFAVAHHARRFAFVSSNEIYGENRGDEEFFDEKYCGYIDCNTMRAGYPESKRCGEALCQAYRAQKNLDIVIPRLTRSYGPTMRMSDTKAISQFIRKGLAGEDIVLKSEGRQYYSYTYMADAVSGLLTVLLRGGNGEAYNVADESGDIRLKDLAAIIAGFAGKQVVYELPDAVERAGYSTATKARLDGGKIRLLGWKPHYAMRDGLWRTLFILQQIEE